MEDRRDAADRVEVRLLTERKYLAAVGEHLVDGEVETLVRCSISVPSSGQRPPLTLTRPHAGHWQAECSTPSWNTRHSTRPSEADSSVSSAGCGSAAAPLRPSSVRRAPTPFAGATSRARAAGLRTARSARHTCDSAVVQPTIAFRAPAARTAPNSLFNSSGQTTTTPETGAGAAVARAHPRPSSGGSSRARRCGAGTAPATGRALVVLARLLLREVGDLLELPGAQPVRRPSSRPTCATTAPSRGRRAGRAARGRGRARP